jgi:hypothetical protein
MEFHTHSLVSIVLYEWILRAWGLSIGWSVAVAFCLAVVMHLVVDLFSQFTYHTKDPHWHDRFWVFVHIMAVLFGLAVVILFAKTYWWLLIAGNLPDITDWFIIRPITKTTPWLHRTMERVRANIFPNMDYSERKSGYIVELALLTILVILIVFLM